VPKFAVIRLGKDSVKDIKSIDSFRSSPLTSLVFDVNCKQVPDELATGDYAFVTLGSDNNKGTETEWKRGLRALGTVKAKSGGPSYKDDWTVKLEVKVVLPESINKKDLLGKSPTAYYWCSNLPILGIETYANQTVQLIDETDDHQKIEALVYSLNDIYPIIKTDVTASYPELVPLFAYSPPSPSGTMNRTINNLIPGATLDLPIIAEQFVAAAEAAKLQIATPFAQQFVSSCLAKRLVIITGLSGSGKTKLTHAFATWITEDKQQFQLVAVGADWTTNENVLGYQDALQTTIYRKPSNGCLDIILRAHNEWERFNSGGDPARPYFLILDEMNLSHVERYFADILSAIESGEDIALHSSNKPLIAHQDDPLPVPAKIRLPENLFIIGTVNIDETTYMFSPKVLDRANVIEFRASAEDIGSFLDNPAKVNMESLAGKGAAFGPSFMAEALAEVTLDDETRDRLKNCLTEVFDELAEIGAEFGYRTAYEITRFVYFHQKCIGDGWEFEEALDAQVLQKLMPKLHGSERKLVPVLEALDAFCEKHTCPISRTKIKRMQDRLKADGFTSFAEA
jgi:energy-coupling factor transporter ATP-binding protein EcfA2